MAPALAVTVLLSAAAALLWRLNEASRSRGYTCYDIYAYAYPMLLRAADAVRHGGGGLLWNPDQNCGEPFLGIGTTGILYPPSWLFAVLSGDQALYGLLFCNLAIGALGAYGLGRELGANRIAAVCGGLTFAFGNQGVDLITYTPIVSGPYAWMAVAMLCTERLLRTRRATTALALAAALAVSLLPGHPQVIFYLYQLIALRVGWELLVARPPRAVRLVGLFGLSLGTAPLFAAAHLLPALETMRSSIRSSSLSVREITLSGSLHLTDFLHGFSARREIDNPISLLPSLVAVGALLTRGARRHALFYAGIAVISVLLATGENSPLFSLYRSLPGGALFRSPSRFLWVTNLCLSALVSIGAEALTRGLRDARPWRRVLAVALPALTLVLMATVVSAIGILPLERWLVGGVIAGCLLTAAWPRAAAVGAAALAVALAGDLIWLRPVPFRTLMDGGALVARAPLFEDLAARRTPQERIYVVPRHWDHTLQQKTGSLFGVPAVYDYESQIARSYAEFFTRLRANRRMGNIDDVSAFGGHLPPTFNWRLLDLAAARYVVVDAATDGHEGAIVPPALPLVETLNGANVYENPTALPRAYWVPQARLYFKPQRLLDQLGMMVDDPRHVVLLNRLPPSGDLGAPSDATGEVLFARDDPEHVVLEIDAPQRGFVVLADQDHPGWRATVNDYPAPILRANYTFRAVEVPAGRSRVEFRFRPRSVFLGFAISAATIGGALAALGLVRWRRRT